METFCYYVNVLYRETTLAIKKLSTKIKITFLLGIFTKNANLKISVTVVLKYHLII